MCEFVIEVLFYRSRTNKSTNSSNTYTHAHSYAHTHTYIHEHTHTHAHAHISHKRSPSTSLSFRGILTLTGSSHEGSQCNGSEFVLCQQLWDVLLNYSHYYDLNRCRIRCCILIMGTYMRYRRFMASFTDTHTHTHTYIHTYTQHTQTQTHAHTHTHTYRLWAKYSKSKYIAYTVTWQWRVWTVLHGNVTSTMWCTGTVLDAPLCSSRSYRRAHSLARKRTRVCLLGLVRGICVGIAHLHIWIPPLVPVVVLVVVLKYLIIIVMLIIRRRRGKVT